MKVCTMNHKVTVLSVIYTFILKLHWKQIKLVNQENDPTSSLYSWTVQSCSTGEELSDLWYKLLKNLSNWLYIFMSDLRVFINITRNLLSFFTSQTPFSLLLMWNMVSQCFEQIVSLLSWSEINIEYVEFSYNSTYGFSVVCTVC